MFNNIFLKFFLLFFLNTNLIYSQKLKKYEKFYDEGNKMLGIGEFSKAIDFFNKSLKLNSGYCPSLYKIGLSYKKIQNFKKFEEYFNKYLDTECSKYFDEVCFSLSEYNFLRGNLTKSRDLLKSISDTLRFIDYSRIMDNLQFNFLSNIYPVIEFSARDTLNYFHYQYSPFYDNRSNTIYFTVRKGDRLFDDENIYTVKYQNNKVSNVLPFEFLNSENNEGTVSLSKDGEFLVFTYCVMDFKKNSCDIYYSKSINGSWSTPQKFNDKINSQFWDSQPFMYDDMLFFVSNRPGGKGGRDIYYSKKLDNEEWGQAKNLRNINSPNEDISPYMYDNILYFASNGSDSYGGYDIFYNLDILDDKSRPNNVGPSVNSYLDETSISIHDNTFLLTQEDKLNQFNKSQIFIGSAKLNHQEAKDISFITIDTSDMRVINSELYIVDDTTKTPIIHDENYIESKYNNSMVLVESLGYFPKVIEIKNDSNIIYMQKIEEKFILEKIYFDFDSYRLNKDSKKYLDIIYIWLRDNKHLNIEISGHTDKIGSDDYNNLLSKNRAKSVYDYLVSKGGNLNNLSFRGYGSSQPIERNYEGDKNRRIEFNIIDKIKIQ